MLLLILIIDDVNFDHVNFRVDIYIQKFWS